MRLDRPLQPGAVGGHSPIRYRVEEYEPGRRVRFRFTGPRGFNGFHEYRVLSMPERNVLQHVIQMTLEGRARLSWLLVFRPLHDALVDDSLDKAERAVTGRNEKRSRWSPWVRTLRWGLRTLGRGRP